MPAGGLEVDVGQHDVQVRKGLTVVPAHAPGEADDLEIAFDPALGVVLVRHPVAAQAGAIDGAETGDGAGPDVVFPHERSQ